MSSRRSLALAILVFAAAQQASPVALGARDPNTTLTLVRVPDDGLQPQVALDRAGHVHLVFLKGDPSASDVYYSHTLDNGTFTPPVRVNHVSGSAMAMGNMRGAHLAIGRTGIVHVAWYGSAKAQPRAPGNTTPILYSRLTAGAKAFDVERNVVQFATRLDGDAIAADDQGHVYVVWHALGPNAKDEGQARLWLTTSADDGGTFAREEAVSDDAAGACGCCGVAVMADARGGRSLLFRSAKDVVHRDAFLVASKAPGAPFATSRLEDWAIGACPMSTFALADTPTGIVAAWETAGRVSFTRVDPSGALSAAVAAPQGRGGQKYPAIAVNSRKDVLFAWTEGMSWSHGGDVVWQVFDANGRPTAEHGRRSGVPAWSLVAVWTGTDGTFHLMY
jgi:hypothetical protein